MGNFAAESSGPLSGFAPAGSLGADLKNGSLYIAGADNNWLPANGLLGLGAQIAAATTIYITNKVHHITGNTAVQEIYIAGTLPGLGTNGLQIILIPDDASGQATSIAGSGAGSIGLATTMVKNKALIMTYDGNLWYPSY